MDKWNKKVIKTKHEDWCILRDMRQGCSLFQTFFNQELKILCTIFNSWCFREKYNFKVRVIINVLKYADEVCCQLRKGITIRGRLFTTNTKKMQTDNKYKLKTTWFPGK